MTSPRSPLQPRGATVGAIAALAWRDTRKARRRLVLFMSSIAIGVAALVAIDSFSENVTRSIREQSRSLLGADLSVTGRQPAPKQVEAALDSLRGKGVQLGEQVNFASMAIVPGHQGTRLVQIRAVTPGVPFYGKIETLPRGRWDALHQGRNAVVDHTLLVALSAQIGDSLALGFARFAIIGELHNVPGDIGVASAFGPRVYIPYAHLDETKLLGFGSRAEYQTLLRVPAGMNPSTLASELKPMLDSVHMRARTVAQTERDLTDAVAQLDRFLGVVGLIALLLGGVGVASAIHSYVAEKTSTVAVLRCLGATPRQVLAVYALEALVLGVIGAGIGVALGVAVQLIMPHVISGFLPLDVRVFVVPRALLVGVVSGVWISLLFALFPLVGLQRVSPLQAIRQDVESVRPPAWRDPARSAVAVAIVATVIGVAIDRAGGWKEGLAMTGGIAAALLSLLGTATAIVWAARRVIKEGWSFTLRTGVANLFRPANQTRAVMLALGFGAFLISTLYLVQSNLLRAVSLSAEASRANLAFFDIQEDQLHGLDSLVRGRALSVLQEVPIVPMRIASVNGRDVASLSRDRPSWALRREYRSSFRDSLAPSEKIVAGRWFGGAPLDSGLSEVSVERSVAEELNVKVGDRIDWDVQGVRVTTRVTSLREVNWARFEPNFFMIFPSAALTAAPKTYVILSHETDATRRARLEREVVDHYPNVSSIDLSTVQETVTRILRRVAVAVRFMAMFSVVTGALVLFSAVAASRRQRIREGVLLKTLGATRAQVRRIMLAEYGVLGLLGSLAGMVLSIGGAWALMRWVFEAPFRVATLPLLAIAVAMMALTIAIGAVGGREVFAATPVRALSEG